MTPIEIFEYKQNWKKDGYAVPFHSDWDLYVREWLKDLPKTAWIWQEYTDVYEHTCLFEMKNDAEALQMDWKREYPRATNYYE